MISVLKKIKLKMRPDLLRMMLVISVLSWVGSITATPVLMRDTFEAGEPISEKEFSNAILSKAAGKFNNLTFLLFPGWLIDWQLS